MNLLAYFSSHLPLTLSALALLVLAVVLALVVMVRRRRVPPEGEEAALAPAPAPGAVVVDFRNAGSQQRFSAAFRKALSELRRHLGGRDSRYRLPWYLLLGEEAAGKSRLFPESGLNLPLGLPEEPSPERGDGVTFWFFDRGVVLDLSGDNVLGPDGRTASERGWRHFTSLLREHRPERPLDGVVVAIPCAGLVGPPGEEGARLAAAAEKGEALFRKLRQAQESLGMNFPVYVLVTGCETIPGFESYVAEIPEHLRGDLFGWSSPYAPETSYRPEWVEEAFSLLGSALHRAQVEAFGDQPVLEDPDGVFCFPEEFQALRVPLRVYLNQIFRASAYHELLPWRGIYFCGRVPSADRRGEFLRDPGAVGGAVFVRDVFDRKVFPERDLARPSSLALLKGGRRLRTLQAAVLLLTLITTLGLWWGAHSLRARKADLRVFLLNTAQDLEEERDRRLRGAVEHAFLHDKAFRMFEGMSKLDAGWFGSLFVPSSWFSSFNGDLRQAIVHAYNEIILKTLSEELGGALDRILAKSRPPAELKAATGDRFIAWDSGAPGSAMGAPPDIRPLDHTPEFTRLDEYVSSLGTLETNITLFNRLRNTESLEDLDAVVRFLFDREMPKSFFKNSELYRQALADVEYKRFQPLQHRPRTTQQAADLVNRLFDHLFRGNPAIADLRRAAELADQVAEAGWDPAAGDEVAALIELRDRLRRSETALASPDLAWMAADTLELGPAWQQLLQGTRATIFLGPDTAQFFQENGDRRFQAFRHDLLEVQARSVGPLVGRDPKSKGLELSPQARLLMEALNGLSRQGFVAAEARAQAPTQTVSPSGRVLWDTVALQQAAGLYKPYEEFIEKTLAPFPPDLRNTLQTSARDRLGARMMVQVAEAQQPMGEPDLSSSLLVEKALESEVASFQAAAAPLAELMDRFGKLGLPASREKVAAAFNAQGEQILSDADRLLALQAPYTPKGRGFEWWNGGRRLAFDAWSARDEADLVSYLAAQRSEVADISSRFAEPVLQALGSRPGSRQMRLSMARWTAIAEQLHRYAGKEPGNSVASLEDLILKDLTEIDPASCGRRITPRQLAEPTSDFFLERRAVLRRQVWDRCVSLAGSQAAQGYQKLAEFFNQRLAGRFPFAASLPGRLDQDAEPEDIRSFFKLYAAYAPLVRAVPEAERPLGAGEFVERMDAVRAFFAPFLDDPDKPETPSWDLAVRFRENRRAEKGGDRIIRWSLASGEALAVHPDTRTPIPWTFGAPLRLELQWAKDSPVIPVESADLPGVHVQGRTAVLELRGRWSLLALLRSREAQVETDPSAQVLRFQVATRPEAEPKAETEMARVFVRVTVRPPVREDKKAAAKTDAPVPAGDLDVPVFPVSAPAWTPRSDAG